MRSIGEIQLDDLLDLFVGLQDMGVIFEYFYLLRGIEKLGQAFDIFLEFRRIHFLPDIRAIQVDGKDYFFTSKVKKKRI
jgi:hypothetical protein